MKKVLIALMAFILLAPPVMYVLNPFGTASYDPRLRILGIAPFRIPSSAMKPSYSPGDIVLASSLNYASGKPKINDVVVYLHPTIEERVAYLSRIVAMGGDSIQMRNGKLFRNGKEITEPFVLRKTLTTRSRVLLQSSRFQLITTSLLATIATTVPIAATGDSCLKQT